ncbi:MAG: phosphatidate cytidylyltransferase [Thermoplasmatota archaeon]|nr:phosphatidate cytidylyltransferase [Candidatus Thermoplasmatota archaeon]MBU1914449.1 phosphatidate cytidylyltransferase [Candidatus Thermoplasmatota archaeon]
MAVSALTEGDLLGLLGVYGYVLAVVVISWLLRDKMSNARKLVHILTGGIVFFWWNFDSAAVMAGLAALPFVLLLLLATPRSPVAFLRKSPLGQRSSEGHPYGLVFYAISWTMIAYLLFDDLFAASIAIAAMSFGDGMGELVGRRYGKIRYLPHRTLEGSLAVFLATLVSTLVISWFYFGLIDYSGGTQPKLLVLFAFAVAGLVAFLEAVTPGAVDNLVLPLFVAGWLHMMGV